MVICVHSNQESKAAKALCADNIPAVIQDFAAIAGRQNADILEKFLSNFVSFESNRVLSCPNRTIRFAYTRRKNSFVLIGTPFFSRECLPWLWNSTGAGAGLEVIIDSSCGTCFVGSNHFQRDASGVCVDDTCDFWPSSTVVINCGLY